MQDLGEREHLAISKVTKAEAGKAHACVQSPFLPVTSKRMQPVKRFARSRERMCSSTNTLSSSAYCPPAHPAIASSNPGRKQYPFWEIANRCWRAAGRPAGRRRLIGLLVGVGGTKGRGAAKERRREARKIAATGRGVALGGARHGGVAGEERLGPRATAGQRSATLAGLRRTALSR